jgi:hypothetical protein
MHFCTISCMDIGSDDRVTGDELRRWLDDGGDDTSPDDGAPPHRRRRWWRVAALAPWLLVALALAVTGGDGRGARTTAPRPPRADAGGGAALGSPTRPATAPSATQAASAQAAPEASPAARRPDGPAGDGPPASLDPVAVGLVRDAVTTTAADGTATALDAAVAGRADPVGDATWLVRIHAVVLRGDRRRWRTARHEVWVAPVGRRDGGVLALDRPWRVAVVDPTPHPVGWRPADGDRGAVRRALRDAGLPTGPDLRLERDPALPTVLRAVTGSSSTWLRAGAHPRVLGTVAG